MVMFPRRDLAVVTLTNAANQLAVPGYPASVDRVERNAATHRRYTEEDLRWVILLTRLRATGMPIRRMREYAELVRGGNGNEAERLALLESHRAAVIEQLDEVQRSLAAIDAKIDLYRELIA